jgi:hypothetical protein
MKSVLSSMFHSHSSGPDGDYTAMYLAVNAAHECVPLLASNMSTNYSQLMDPLSRDHLNKLSADHLNLSESDMIWVAFMPCTVVHMLEGVMGHLQLCQSQAVNVVHGIVTISIPLGLLIMAGVVCVAFYACCCRNSRAQHEAASTCFNEQHRISLNDFQEEAKYYTWQQLEQAGLLSGHLTSIGFQGNH